jgi:hypothetical protein
VTLAVSDFLSNANDQLFEASKIVGRSKHRQAIFEIVYKGQKQTKTVSYIMAETDLSQTHVLKEGGKMAGLLIEKVPGGYRKKKEFATRYKRILAMARDAKKAARLPTKTSPKIGHTSLKLSVSPLAPKAALITIDQIGSFKRVQGTDGSTEPLKLSEGTIKQGFQKIIGESGTFKDWGGEKSDLFTTRIRLNGKRVSAAIAFKGKATSGKLVPAKMGKNGDQINRLFSEPAYVFLVVYGGQIDSSILAQMQAFAIGLAIGGKRVRYGTIDGKDLRRIVSAYPKEFRLGRRP